MIYQEVAMAATSFPFNQLNKIEMKNSTMVILALLLLGILIPIYKHYHIVGFVIVVVGWLLLAFIFMNIDNKK